MLVAALVPVAGSSKNFDSGAFSSVNAETLDSGHSRRP